MAIPQFTAPVYHSTRLIQSEGPARPRRDRILCATNLIGMAIRTFFMAITVGIYIWEQFFGEPTIDHPMWKVLVVTLYVTIIPMHFYWIHVWTKRYQSL